MSAVELVTLRQTWIDSGRNGRERYSRGEGSDKYGREGLSGNGNDRGGGRREGET